MSAKASFSLSDFTSFVKTKGLAKVNRFEVDMGIPPGIGSTRGEARKISLLCEISNFPPLNLTVKPFKIFGPSYQRPITSEYGGDGISMTFHVDREMSVKRFFDDWMENIVRRNDFTVNYQENYATTIRIRQLDEGSLVNEPVVNLTNAERERNVLNAMYEIELLEAFPRSMTIMDLNNSAQSQTHRLNIIFAYRYWRRTDIPINLNTIQLLPIVSLQTDPIIRPIKPTDTSRTLDALGGRDPNVGFEDSTFSVPSA